MQSAGLEQKFAALADPNRLTIVSRLARGEASVNELARSMGDLCSAGRKSSP